MKQGLSKLLKLSNLFLLIAIIAIAFVFLNQRVPNKYTEIEITQNMFNTENNELSFSFSIKNNEGKPIEYFYSLYNFNPIPQKDFSPKKEEIFPQENSLLNKSILTENNSTKTINESLIVEPDEKFFLVIDSTETIPQLLSFRTISRMVIVN